MAHTRDLYKTKLCTLHQKGHCPRLSCSFAHGEAELRRFPGVGGFNEAGRRDNHRSGEFRDKGDRHGSPDRRRSFRRDGRGRQGSLSDRRFPSRDRFRSSDMRSMFRRRSSRSYSPRPSRSYSPRRSPSLESESRKSKKLRMEAPDAHLSDVSADHDHYVGDKEEMKSPPKSISESPTNALHEQLRQVQLDNKALLEAKENLEKDLEKKVEEGSVLSAQNTELDSKLASAQADCRRCSSKMKKLIKTFMRFSRAQDEVKRTQSKLQKMAEDVSNEDNQQRPSTLPDESDCYNLSDGELEKPTNGITGSAVLIPDLNVQEG